MVFKDYWFIYNPVMGLLMFKGNGKAVRWGGVVVKEYCLRRWWWWRVMEWGVSQRPMRECCRYVLQRTRYWKKRQSGIVSRGCWSVLIHEWLQNDSRTKGMKVKGTHW